MPESSEINPPVLPDFSILRKPLSDLATSLDGLPEIVNKLRKGITSLVKIDTNTVQDKILTSQTQKPTELASQLPVQPLKPLESLISSTTDNLVSTDTEDNNKTQDTDTDKPVPVVSNVNTTNNKYTTTQTNPWTSLYNNNEESVSNTQNTTQDNNQNTTLISKLLGGVQNTVKNISSRRENTGETFLQSVMNISKDKIKHAKLNVQDGWSAGRIGEEPKQSGMLSGIGEWFGDAWKEQREMGTPAAATVDAFKALKSGNVKDVIKSTVSATQSATKSEEDSSYKSKYEKNIDISKLTDEQKKTREQLIQQSSNRSILNMVNDPFNEKQKQAQQQLEQFDKNILDTSGSNITSAGDSINDGAKRIKQATEPQFPVPNSPHAAEYITKAGENINEGVSEIQKTSEKFLDSVKSTSELNNLFQFPIQDKKQLTSALSNTAQPVDETTSAAVGQRDAKQYGPEKVEIVNFKELAEEISELMSGKFEALSKSSVSDNTASDGDDTDSSLLDLLGMGAVGSGLGAGDKKNKNKNKTKNKTKGPKPKKPGLFKRLGSTVGKFVPKGKNLLKIGGVAAAAIGTKLGYDKLTQPDTTDKPKKSEKPKKTSSKQVKSAPKPGSPLADAVKQPPEPTAPKTTTKAPPKPDAVKPDAVKPDAVKPDAVKPAPKPDAVKPAPKTTTKAPSKPDAVKPAPKPDAVKPAPKPKPKPKAGFFSSMWSKTKKLASKIPGADTVKSAAGGLASVVKDPIGAAKKAVKGVASTGKKALTAVKSGVGTAVKYATNPKLALKTLKEAVKTNAKTAVKQMIKVPIVSAPLEALFAGFEIKDILNNQELSPTDKKKQTGRVVGNSIGGLMGGALAAVVPTLLTGGAAGLAAPILYMGGDYLGRVGADVLMNSVPDIEEILGETTGNVFGLDYGDEEQPATGELTPDEKKELEDQLKPIDTKNIDAAPADSTSPIKDTVAGTSTPAVPDNKVTITPDEVETAGTNKPLTQGLPATAALGAASAAATGVPGKQKAPTATSGKSAPGKPIKAKSLAGKAALATTAAAAATAATASAAKKPEQSATTTPISTAGVTPVAKKLESTTQTTDTDKQVPVPLNKSTIGHSESEPIYVKHVEPEKEPGASTPQQSVNESETKPSGIISKVAGSAAAVYPGSMIGRAVTGGKTLLGKANKVKDEAISSDMGQKVISTSEKALDKTKQIGTSTIKGGKTLLGKAMSTNPGQKTKATGSKIMDKTKYFASQAGDLGSNLLGKVPAAGTAMKLKASRATNAIKGKISKPVQTEPAKPAKSQSFLGKMISNVKSLFTKTKDIDIKSTGAKALDKGKYFANQAAGLGMSLAGKAKQKATDVVNSETGEKVKYNTSRLMATTKSTGVKALDRGKTMAKRLPGKLQQKSTDIKSKITGKISKPSSMLGKISVPFKRSESSKISYPSGNNPSEDRKSTYMSQLDGMSDWLKPESASPTTGEKQPNRLKDMMKSASDSVKDKSKNFIESAVPLSQKLGSKALAGAAVVGERSKQFVEKVRDTDTDSKSNDDSNQGSTNSTSVISTNNSSSNSTIVNRFDTDVVSKWRSQFVDDQHRPGHYSMYS